MAIEPKVVPIDGHRLRQEEFTWPGKNMIPTVEVKQVDRFILQQAHGGIYIPRVATQPSDRR